MLRLVLKIICWVIGILIVLGAATVWALTSYFTPERITKLIEEKSSEYLNAEVKIGSLNYKIFKTYPWLYFEVDSIDIISKSLSGITKQQFTELPTNADSLASVIKLSGKINIHSLLHDKVWVRDIEVVKPWLNIVMVNDSVSNFNIAPDLPKIKKLPEIDISQINVESPVDINFFTLQYDACIDIGIESFYFTKKEDDFYKIGFDGNINGRYGEFSLPGELPLKFITGVKLNLPDISLLLRDLSFSLAGLSLEAKGDILADGKNIDFQKLEVSLNIKDVFELIQTLPVQIAQKLPLPSGLSGVVPVYFTAYLPKPYHIKLTSLKDISIENLPNFSASVNIENAQLEFIPPQGRNLYAEDIYLDLDCNFDPENSEETNLLLKELRLNGEGVSLYGFAEVNNVTGEQQNFEGDFRFDTSLMRTLSYLIPNKELKIDGHLNGNLQFSGEALNLGKEGFKDLALEGEVKTKSLNVNSTSAGIIQFKNIKGDFRGAIPSYPLSNYAGTKLDFNFGADSIRSITTQADVKISNLKVDFEVKDTVSGNPNPFGNLKFLAKGMDINAAGNKLKANDIVWKAKGSLKSSSPSNQTPVRNLTPEGNGELIESRIAHTPLQLVYNGGGILQTVMNMVNLDTDLTIKKSKVITPAYLLSVETENFELMTDLNDLKFKAGNITLGNSSFSILGELEGLYPFLTSYSATPLMTSMDINFNNVDINQLSWGYYGALKAQGKDSVFYIPSMTPYTQADSLCVAIPRNLQADIRLKAKSAQYMNYSFSPLSTDISISNGAATLKDLTIGTSYATVIVDWTYSTTNLDNIFMNLKGRLKDFEFLNFYKAFPDLVSTTPELQNFTGKLNADFNCNFEMFPDMFMNAESLKGNFNIKGQDLEFARKGKIEKITHLMLIEGNEPIKINNIGITGGYHDNILQLNPFNIGFDDYELGLGGVLNTNGKMYFHLALKKSPFHLPFGVSLFGKMKHPEIRFGGTHMDDFRSEMVSTDVESKIDVNIMSYLRHGWLIFIQKAAQYEEGK